MFGYDCTGEKELVSHAFYLGRFGLSKNLSPADGLGYDVSASGFISRALIHDSVATTEGNKDYVKRVMEEEIKMITGLDASIDKEYWTPSRVSSLTPTHQVITGKGTCGKAA
jgi:hypothetical protein